MSKIRMKDHVVVLSGKDKGRRGAIVKVLDDDTVVVEGVNMVKKHQKPRNSAAGPQPGGIVEREAPIHLSNVMLFNPATSKGERVGFKTLDDGRKVRVYRSSGEVVDA